MIEKFIESAKINKVETIVTDDVIFLKELGLDYSKEFDVKDANGFVKALSAAADNALAVIDIDSKEKLKQLMDCENLFIVLRRSDIKGNLFESYRYARKKKQCAYYIFMSGESKTADIEKVLVSGVQGPKKVTFVCLKSQSPG